ncbi:hypothetical protein ABZY44_08370 [Streptomyces sp. NPDC006544]|uniref:hypothetical protein n=1 Tax=Streptomyces sp. NPDC006544 TaxID=3154583 RepID=UPI0033B79916
MTPGRCCRALRAAMFAATCVLLSSLGHVLMSGTSVPWWTMAAAFAGTSAAGWLLAGRERGLAAVTAATVGVQAALHGAFALAQAAATVASGPGGSAGPGALARRWAQYVLCAPPALLPQPPAPAGGGGGHAQHALHAVHAMADGVMTADGTMADGAMPTAPSMAMPLPMAMPMPMSAGHDSGAMSPVGMLAVHLLAALFCGLWLAYGERGAFRVLRAVAARLLVPLRLFFRLPAPAHRPRVRFGRDLRARVPRGLLLADALTSRGPPHGTAVI